MSIRVSMRGMLKLIRDHISRRDHNVGFLAGRLEYIRYTKTAHLTFSHMHARFYAYETEDLIKTYCSKLSVAYYM